MVKKVDIGTAFTSLTSPSEEFDEDRLAAIAFTPTRANSVMCSSCEWSLRSTGLGPPINVLSHELK